MGNMDTKSALAYIASVYRSISETDDKSDISLFAVALKYSELRPDLQEVFPHIFSFMPGITLPQTKHTEYGSYAKSEGIKSIEVETKAFLDFWSTLNSKNTSISPLPKKVFISHGRKEDWRKVQEYVERTLEIPTLELAQEANKGRTIFQKLVDESDSCGYAIIIMTGDDLTTDEQIRARENVIHELGYFQGKYGPDRVCLLHEEGVNIPTNIAGWVYIPFPEGGIEAALGGITRELKHL
ncbi:putative nucleotide-binding protein [Deinococcus radiopugnans ATCC 19172]|uniref:Nucleotide-binding protein n=2 Tax=Deinococcus radiopugnans ATCC 19172 TaxID=585398 RepID=A0ABR6NTD8_9DEIO|nr:putative nucleotide-binding protein [Deinococcus radiopugnans ATCC 19172]